MLSEVEKLKLPDMVIPDNVLESGKKSFTVPVPSRPGVDCLAKNIEVKFYPHPGRNLCLCFVTVRNQRDMYSIH